MFRRNLCICVCSLIAAIGFGAAANAPKPADASADRIAALVNDLDSAKYTAREAASSELLKIGEPALPALKDTLAHTSSFEVKKRCTALIQTITTWGGAPQELRLKSVLDEVRSDIRMSDKLSAIEKGRLEKLLTRFMHVFADAAQQGNRTLPVDFKKLHAIDFDPAKAFMIMQETSALVVLKRGTIPIVRNSVVIADEQVEINSAENAIIIARVAAKVLIARNSVIIAGKMLDVTSDDHGVLLSGGDCKVNVCRDSVVGAAGAFVALGVNDATTVNTKLKDNSGLPRGFRQPLRSVQIPQVDLGDTGDANVLTSRLHVTGGFPEQNGVALFRLASGKGEYVARYGEPVLDTNGRPINELKGWKLCFANDRMAVFTDGDKQIALPVAAKPAR